jgi:predicted double-glycine peptidase
MKPFPVPFDVIVMLASMMLGAFYGRGLHRRGVRLSMKTDARQAGGLAVACIGMIGVSIAFMLSMTFPRVVWYFPPAVDYHGIPAAWVVVVTALGLVFGTAAMMVWLQQRRAVWAILPACALVFGGSEWVIQNSVWFTQPVIEISRVDENGVIRQTSATTCAAAACANVLRALGVEKTERDMVETLGTTDNGTTTGQIIYGMRRIGFECKKRRIADSDFTKLNAPALLFVTAAGIPLGHAVAYMGCRDGKAEVWNSASGRQMLTRDELAQTWLGHAVEVRKAGQQ